MLKLSARAEYCTDKGIRPSNQDNLYFNGHVLERDTAYDSCCRIFRRPPMLFAVCDGMGGESHGDEASYTAAALLQEYQNEIAGDVKQAFNHYVAKANQEILKLGRAGTTLVSLILKNDNATVAHLGDSRAYLFRYGSVTLLTEDHTQKRAFGGENGQQARSSVLTRHLGIDMHDLVIKPTYTDIKVCRGDIFVLCSDGLTDMADIVDISGLLKKAKYPARALVEAAMRNGSTDNTTAITVKIT